MNLFMIWWPTIPVAMLSAVLFKGRSRAWGYFIPVIFEAFHYAATQWSPLFFATAAALMGCVACMQWIVIRRGTALRTLIAGTFVSVSLFWVLANFSVWFMGSCLPGVAMYSASLSGLAECFQAGIPFLVRSWILNIPSSLILIYAGMSALKLINSRAHRAA